MAVVCLLTPGQPSTNPRLVKEAVTLVEAGHTVHVVCAHWAGWADETDRTLLESQRFSCTYVGGRPGNSMRYLWTRIRHRLGRNLLRLPVSSPAPTWALCRVSPELQRAAERIKADLYIAHNLGALPAAWGAARRHGAKLGFDAEDFHSGMSPHAATRSAETLLTKRFEKQILPQCDYVTAAAPLIAQRYSAKYHIPAPTTILNVFPLSERPASFRDSETDSPLTLYWFSQTVGADRGLEDIVRAMGALREYPVVLHVQGTWQGGYESKLRHLAAELRLRPEQIASLPPSRPDALVRLASTFDVGLALEPGRDENNDITLSNKLFTYLLAGNAICATSTQGQRRLIEETEGAGFGYEPKDANSLAAQLRRWCVDREALNVARRRAWDYGTRKFNWDMEKSKFLNVVQNVLSLPTGQVA